MWPPKHRITQEEQDRAYLELAYRNAKEMSVDPSTQNGSLLVSMDEMVDAANYFPHGVMTDPSRWEPPMKYAFIEHAERNAIYAAARLGIPTEGSVLYCPWFACYDCARGIIQAGISRVVGHLACFEKTPDRWKESINIAFTMLHEANVKCDLYDGVVFGPEIKDPISIRFNTEIWRP